jgi:peptidoglycan/LPS O-acetylase OafA/YrhL
MTLISPLPILSLLMIGLFVSYFIAKFVNLPAASGRFASIDGLRGYAAFFVFLHHASVWLLYLKTGDWSEPSSHLYNHLGKGSVAFFFMVTGFLFFSKLLNGKTRKIDWLKLFVSRIYRLTPLYFFTMCLFTIIVGAMTQWQLHESVVKLVVGLMRWFTFTASGSPDVNTLSKTYSIVAGVTWTLRYEWLFYLALPLFALFLRLSVPLPYVVLGLLTVAGFTAVYMAHVSDFTLFPLLFFVGGMIAAVVVRYPQFKQYAVHPLASLVIIVCIALSVYISSTAFSLIPLIALTVAFCLIAGGNSLFGALTNQAARCMGEISYSIYLMHGMMMYVLFNFVIGKAEAATFSPLMHWTVIGLMVPALLIVCQLTYTFIEVPFIKRTELATEALRQMWLRRSNKANVQPALNKES